jgi:hypothetical protein
MMKNETHSKIFLVISVMIRNLGVGIKYRQQDEYLKNE